MRGGLLPFSEVQGAGARYGQGILPVLSLPSEAQGKLGLGATQADGTQLARKHAPPPSTRPPSHLQLAVFEHGAPLGGDDRPATPPSQRLACGATFAGPGRQAAGSDLEQAGCLPFNHW